MTICTFDLDWRGPCGRENCQEHANLRCCSCGAPATRSCPETLRMGVCGAILCNDCGHTDNSGTRSGPTAHGSAKDRA